MATYYVVKVYRLDGTPFKWCPVDENLAVGSFTLEKHRLPWEKSVEVHDRMVASGFKVKIRCYPLELNQYHFCLTVAVQHSNNT